MPTPRKELPEFAEHMPPFFKNFMTLKTTPLAEADPTLGVEEQEPDSKELADIMAAAGEGCDL